MELVHLLLLLLSTFFLLYSLTPALNTLPLSRLSLRRSRLLSLAPTLPTPVSQSALAQLFQTEQMGKSPAIQTGPHGAFLPGFLTEQTTTSQLADLTLFGQGRLAVLGAEWGARGQGLAILF